MGRRVSDGKLAEMLFRFMCVMNPYKVGMMVAPVLARRRAMAIKCG